jgi:hypothetical protein
VMRASACSWAVCRCSEQDLDHPDIDVLLEQVGRKAMAQSMRRHVLGDLGHLGNVRFFVQETSVMVEV